MLFFKSGFVGDSMKRDKIFNCVLVTVLLVLLHPSAGYFRAMELADLNSSHRVDWSHAGCAASISSDKGNIVNIKEFGVRGDGRSDETVAIQTAIKSISLPGILYFPAGVYLITAQLSLPSNIVLRGQGVNATRIDCKSAEGCIGVKGKPAGEYTPLRREALKGNRHLLVDDTSGFTIGQGGQVQQNDIVRAEAQWGEGSVGQMVTIVAIEGNTLTVDPPLHLGFPLLRASKIRPIRFVQHVGVEDLTIRRIDSGANRANNIDFRYAANCWLQRVNSVWTEKHHISGRESLHLEIRDSFVQGAKSKGSGGFGYGVSLNKHATSILVENNIFYDLRHSMIIQMGANGCVFGYNFAKRNYSDDDGGWAKTYISLHGHYPFMNLFEGNIVAWAGVGDYWGPIGPGNTFFRNRVSGTDRFDGEGERHGISVGYVHGAQNLIGNELTGGSIYYSAKKEHPDLNYAVEWEKVVDHANNVQGTSTATLPGQGLPDSFYLKGKPHFFGSMKWPSLGGDSVLGQGTIPARERYLFGTPGASSVPVPSGSGATVPASMLLLDAN